MFRFAHLLPIACLAPPLACAAPDIQPGLWEITSQVRPPSLPFGLAMPPNSIVPRSAVYTKCITPEDIERPRAFVQDQTGCTFTDLQVGSSAAHWTAACSQPAPSRSTGHATFDGATAQGASTLTMTVEGFELPVRISFSGRRLGTCP